MDQDETLNWLPAAWRKVFTTKQQGFSHLGVGGAERCLLDYESDSAYGFYSNQRVSSSSSSFHDSMAASLSPFNGFHGSISAASASSSSSSPLPDWFSLLTALMTRSNDDQQIIGILQLPVHMQRTTLGLVSHHALEIPLPLLQKFTRAVQDRQLTDHWSLFHLHTLQNHIATHLPEVTDQKSKHSEFVVGQRSRQLEVIKSKAHEGMGQSSKSKCLKRGSSDIATHLPYATGQSSMFQRDVDQSSNQQEDVGQRLKSKPFTESYISKRSRNLFGNVCKSINDRRKQQAGLPQLFFPEYSGMKCFVEYFESRKDEDGLDGQNGQDFKTKEDVKMTSTGAPSDIDPSRWKAETSTETVDFDQHAAITAGSAGGVLVKPPPVLNGQELEGITDMDVFPEEMDTYDAMEVDEEAKQNGKISVGEEQGEESKNGDDGVVIKEPLVAIGDEQSFIDGLSDDLKSQLNQMKTGWHGESSLGATEVKGCNEAIKLMSTCTPAQLSEICDFLDVGSASVSTLPVICQCIIPLASHFSFISSVLLAERLFLGKVTNLTHNPPRVLTTSLTDFAKSFPKPAIEGVLTPCLVGQGSMTFQVDLVSKVAKEALSVDLRSHLLRNVLTNLDFVWSDSFSGFVQGLVDAKLELDSSLLGLLTSSLAGNATTQAQCKKFAKLLLAVITKFSKQLTQDHVTNLQRSVEVNQTFLKKACQNALKKVKL